MPDELGADAIVDPSAGIDTPNPAKEGHPADDIVDESVEVSEATKEVTEEATEEVTEKLEPEEIDQELVKKAMEGGLTKESAESFDNESLQRVVRKLDTKQFTTTSDATVTSDAAKVQDEPKLGKQYKLKVSDDVYEKELTDGVESVIGELSADVQAQFNQLAKQNQLLVAEAAAREEREETARFDNMITGLPKGYKDTFGEETPTKVQQANRNALRSQMRVERYGREHEELPSLRDEQLFEKALGSQHQNVTKQLAREEITSKLKGRKGQIIATPTNTQAPTKYSRAKAIEAIDDFIGGGEVETEQARLVSDEEAMKIFD